MANETVTLSVQKGIGYRGKNGARSYIARITGTSDTYIFARDFVETTATDRDEMFTARRKGKGTWREAAAVEQGLYEIEECGSRAYRIVWRNAEGEMKWTRCDADRAQAIALLLDRGETLESARVATKPPSAPATEVRS